MAEQVSPKVCCYVLTLSCFHCSGLQQGPPQFLSLAAMLLHSLAPLLCSAVMVALVHIAHGQISNGALSQQGYMAF